MRAGRDAEASRQPLWLGRLERRLRLQRIAYGAGCCVDGGDTRHQRFVEQAQQGAQFSAGGGELFAVVQGAGVYELF